MNKTKNKTSKPAFTLLEILIAMSMTVLILASVYATYSTAIKASSRSTSKHDLQQQASLFLQIITSELRCTHPATINRTEIQIKVRSTNAGIKPKRKKTYPPVFQGINATTPIPFLSFITTSPNTRRAELFNGLTKIHYTFDPQTSTILKATQKHLNQTEENIQTPQYIPILENIISATPEFFDGSDWTNNWNSKETKNTLPKAVRITIESQTEDSQIMSFTATARLDCIGKNNEKPKND